MDAGDPIQEEARTQPAQQPLIGDSAPMQAVLRLIERVAPTDASVLITGETGSGKEFIAQMIHARSERAAGPFVAINCGAVPAGLIEAELFGYEKGSFTGAMRPHAGVFERAEGGTLLLDEVTELPLDMQARLLRVLETRTLYRVGGNSQIAVNVRMIAATNGSPADAVRDGRLREDLLHRLAAFPVPVPPLRAQATLRPPQVIDRTRLEIRVGSRIDDVERSLIEATLAYFEGNKRRTAETLGCSLKTLYNKLNSYCRKQEFANS